MARRQHAIVIGGSIAGMLAARVLTEHFAQVTLVERDSYPEDPEVRKGVPQARHIHQLLLRGMNIAEELFPGLLGELEAAGAIRFDLSSEFVMLTLGGWNSRFRSGRMGLVCSRALIDWAIQRRLRALPRLRVLLKHDVVGLLHDAAAGRVLGVELRQRPEEGAQEAPVEQLEADLVVDASGRGALLPDWLEALGYGRPRETTVNSYIGYATRCYEIPADGPRDWKIMFLLPDAPAMARGGGIFTVEGGRWMVTLAGAARDYPPTDEAAFLEFARSLRSPLVYETIKNARPISGISGYRRTENRLLHYDRMQRWPQGLAVLGDATCAFNPVYGQGMSSAAIGAALLGQCLRQQPAFQPQRFQRLLARENAAIWLLATGEDFRYPTTEGGKRSFATGLIHRYMDQVVRLAMRDPASYMALVEVLQLVKPAATLFRPWLLARVLRSALRPAPPAPQPELERLTA